MGAEPTSGTFSDLVLAAARRIVDALGFGFESHSQDQNINTACINALYARKYIMIAAASTDIEK